MTTSRDGLPHRGPADRLGPGPQLPPYPGAPDPFKPRELSAQEEFPGPEAPPTIKEASLETPVARVRALGAPPAVEEGEELPQPVLGVPRSFDELIFHAVLLNPSREVSVVVEQAIAPGASGSVTVNLPANRVDVARTLREGGDGSVSYEVEVDGPGRVAVAQHRVTGGERSFARYFEKYSSVTINFTNHDPANAALLQVEWVSVQVDTTKWLAYRNNVRAWSRLLGVQE